MDAAIDIAARLSGATTDVATRVTGAIRHAAKATGAGFDYLLNTALRESNLNPDAKAKTSSATGLFQFIDQTWLGTMKQSGGGLGYGKYADAITRTSDGRFAVSDPAMRREIMALRKDPTANSLMAGAFANSNAKVLNDRLGRKPTDGELYMAHFLGASGAARFIKAAEARPDAAAANYFPKAAHANASIFYNKQGGAKSLKQVYAGLVAKHNVIGPTQLASLRQPEAVKQANAAKPADGVKPEMAFAAADTRPLAFFRDVPAAPANATATPVSASPAIAAINAATATAPIMASAVPPAHQVAQAAPAARQPGPMFESLYQGDDRGAVAPVVRELWGARRAAATETPVAITPAEDPSSARGTSVNTPLDLFQFPRPSARRPA